MLLQATQAPRFISASDRFGPSGRWRSTMFSPVLLQIVNVAAWAGASTNKTPSVAKK